MDTGVVQASPAASAAATAPSTIFLRGGAIDSVNGMVVALGLVLFAAVWLAELSFTSLSPPVDNIEQLIWVRALEWGYYKHPPLPTWLIWLPVKLFGASAATSYALGAAFTLGAMGTLWGLLSRLRGNAYATVALLAALCVTYYNDRLFYYNHNTVLLFLSAVCAALSWQAFTTGKLRWWCGLGLALGLAALSKYQAVVTIASILVFALHQRAWRVPAQRRGILLAGLIALVVFAPHVYWLREHDFGPIDYAVESSLGAQLDPGTRPLAALHWLADQVLNRLLPALLLLTVTGFDSRGNRSVRTRRHALAPAHPKSASRAFLLTWGIVPLLFTPLVGLAVGADLQLQWGTPFLLFAVPAAMELAPVDFRSKAHLDKALRIFLSIQALLLAVNFLTSPRGAIALRDHHWGAFDSAELADIVAPSARGELGGRIAIIGGSTSIAGALALGLPEHPLVLIDGRFDRSPWLVPRRVRQCGALEIGSIRDMPGGKPVGAAFPGLAWRVTRRESAAAPCPVEAY